MKYQTLDIQGFISCNPCSKKFEIVTNKLIYFYCFEEEDQCYIPKLESIMFNFFECSDIMVDANSTFCITYKSNEPNFRIIMRKYDHGFHEIIEPKNMEGCKGRRVDHMDIFLVSDGNKVLMYDERSLERKDKNTTIVPAEESQDEDPIEILNIKISQNSKFVGVLQGKNQAKGIEELHNITIYQFEDEEREYHLQEVI